MPRYYPICLDIREKPCLVVGGGAVAERKIMTLLDYEAKVSVISPKATHRITHLGNEGRLTYMAREFEPGDTQGFFLVIAATDHDQINRAISQEARQGNILVNVVDSPDESTFILPALIRRGDLTISISTGGNSPALARKIREDMEAQYGHEYEILVDILGNLRKNILQQEPDILKRKKIFQQLAQWSELLKIIRESGREAAEERIREFL
ncbi:MAG: bifunctional precorrin-2 dehydrogenase/sirohydrochlorin ferrochelatase [bacterium]|nr:bifunctional precorrin-2 dehydrogenase/sirohydrochlorin ferrochelatase [bacterium]